MISANLVKNHMTKVPTSIRDDESIALAYRLVQENGFRHLPVVNAKGVIVGMISDRDLRSIQVTADVFIDGFEEQMQKVPISDIMSKDVRSINEEDTLQTAASYMVDLKFNALPVTDSDSNTLVGIITSTDILKLVLSGE